MATPHVSGVAALVKSMNQSLTAVQIKNIILSTVDVKDSLSGKVSTGGRLNAYRAVLATLPAPPFVNFTASPISGVAPLTVVFTDQSMNSPTTWNWSFGEGTWLNYSGQVPLNPVHTYYDYGTYTVSLTATNSGGSNTKTRVEYIHVMNGMKGMTGVGVFRPSTHMFYLRNGTTTWTTTAINWGASTDLPVTGDWNGDGIVDVGVFRPSTHMFYLRNGTTTWTTTAINWGVSTDLPVTGKWS